MEQFPTDTAAWKRLDVTSNVDVGANAVSKDVPGVLGTSAKIKAIIGASNEPRVLYFPAGSYYLDADLPINVSNLVIRGAGAGRTVIHIVPAKGNAEIHFEGGGIEKEVDVTDVPLRGAGTVAVASTDGLVSGRTVAIFDKSRGFAFAGGPDSTPPNASPSPTSLNYHFGQLAKISAVAGNVVSLDMKLGLDFNGFNGVGGDPKLRLVKTIDHVGIEELTVTRDAQPLNDDGTIDDNASNIAFRFVTNGHVDSVETARIGRAGIDVAFSIDMSIRNNNVHDAFDFGGGGRAYGIYVEQITTRCTVFNNKVWNERHHVILALGANHTIVSYNSAEPTYNGTTGDLSIHGFSPHNNLFEGNMGAVMSWDGRSNINAREQQGLYNVAYRNFLSRKSLGGANDLRILDAVQGGNLNHFGLTIVANVIPNIGFYSGASGTIMNDGSGIPKVIGSNVVGGAIQQAIAGVLPASLYRTGPPANFLPTDPWPLFGPDVAGYGVANSNPAARRQ